MQTYTHLSADNQDLIEIAQRAEYKGGRVKNLLF